jgi:hypothetical protein
MYKPKIMKNYLLLFTFLALFLVPNVSNAQEEDKLGVKINGLIWAENIFDTRQTVTAREGDVPLSFFQRK